MRVFALSTLLAASLVVPACGDSGGGSTESSASESSSESASSESGESGESGESTEPDSESGGSDASATDSSTGGDTSTTGSGMESCADYTTQETCAEPCAWRFFNAYDTAGGECTNLTPVGLCVFESGDTDAGCAIPGNCSDAWGYIDTGETLAFAPYCGGTPPEGWTACTEADINGGIPECGCACGLKGVEP